MGLNRFRFELGVKLDREKPWMIFDFDDLDQRLIVARPGDLQPVGLKLLTIRIVKLVAVTMAFVNRIFAIALDLSASRRPTLTTGNPIAWCRPCR